MALDRQKRRLANDPGMEGYQPQRGEIYSASAKGLAPSERRAAIKSVDLNQNTSGAERTRVRKRNQGEAESPGYARVGKSAKPDAPFMAKARRARPGWGDSAVVSASPTEFAAGHQAGQIKVSGWGQGLKGY